MKNEESMRAFKEKLDEQHDWPTIYMFKFVVPASKESDVIKLFSKSEINTKSSSGGKYRSITAKVLIKSSDEVLMTYAKANKIEGLIAL